MASSACIDNAPHCLLRLPRHATNRFPARLHQFENRSKNYKLFNEPTTREVVFRRLVEQLRESKSIRKNPKVQLCLAAGKIIASHTDGLRSHFDENNWLLYDAGWIREQLQAISDSGYENSIAAVTAKLLLRSS
ncbi:hypothetical protein Mal64_01360 [Pseudobythopirellula maris]|uniref:Uncharacterized protein n=1 Tax=Pseudobythopirellula maris TaxID=2527991 RepID=A0A5C5ZS40_9BACT|nr:hypothetical protein [Pseudobythopirellula maris]TWT89757.1 hypothetical protein Mal64_01360 [Pseudobythopirellula maris]